MKRIITSLLLALACVTNVTYAGTGGSKPNRETVTKIYDSLNPKNFIPHMAHHLANDDNFKRQAETMGWTTSSCNEIGLGFAGGIIAVNAGNFCAAETSTHVQFGSCLAAISGVSYWIVKGACTHLCHNHTLRDCQ